MRICTYIVAITLMLASTAAAEENQSAAATERPATANDKNQDKESKLAPSLNFEMETLDGKKVNLAEKYQGKVVLLVNVASKCGYTPQYKGLQALHEKYADRGLAIVGVPSNQFGRQEPGTSDQIAEFCETNYGVTFDMLAKVNVRAGKEDQAPLYKYLTSKETNPKHGGDVKWNFEKFLIDADGEVIGHYRSKVKPESKELVAAIEKALEGASPKEDATEQEQGGEQ